MIKTFLKIAAAVLLLLVFSPSAFSGDGVMPINQILPGMRGVGKTVFIGSGIEEFDFVVLEIMPNFHAKRDIILVKLIGEKVEHTGVVAGMSGSPMYIDGKLVGALAYRFGLFSKEPIAGITPIDQMFEVFAHEKVRAEELAMNDGFNPDFLEMAVGVKDISLENLIPPQWHVKPSNFVSQISPLAIPLIFSGFQNSGLETSAQLFGGMGFEVVSAGGSVAGSETSNTTSLQPGSAFSVVLVDGDYGLQATGTVTYVDGDRVLGMGHPFLDFGAVSMPLAEAKILTTLSSAMASTKISAQTRVVGTVHQDRTTGIMGVSGETAELLPVRLRFRSQLLDSTEFNFWIAQDRSLNSFTPLIFSLVVADALESARLSFGNATLQFDGKINLRDHNPILLQNYFAGSTPSAFVTDGMEATGEIAATIGTLVANDFETPKIESVELNFTSLPKKSLATVQRIEVDKTVVKPGDKIGLTVYVKEFQGKEIKLQRDLYVPNDIESKRLTIFAGGGDLLRQLEFRSSPQKFRPRNFEQLIELLQERRKNNFLFIQIRENNRGVTVGGEEFPSLPPSILSVMNVQKSSGNVVVLRERVLNEESVQLDFSISGGRSIALKVEPKDE